MIPALRNEVIRYTKAAIFAALVFVLGSQSALADERTIVVNGVERQFILDAGEGTRPLIIALHGGGGSAKRFRRKSGLQEAALAAGFAIVFPDSDRGNWNDGRLRPDGEVFNDEDDTAFLLSLVKTLVDEGVALPNRIYITGHSNGGMMSFAMGCRYPKLFRAIAPVSANVPLPMGCTSSGAISVLNIVGLKDRVVPFEGGGIFGRKRRGELLSVNDGWVRMLQKNGCARGETVDRGRSFLLTGVDCARPTFQVRVKAQGHSWPDGEVETIIKFFADLR